ncbi:MAG: DUF2138 family protein [Magnetococcales bacterium]|nr:DUF2138 family protein [Magnetococcales bacterium]
MAFPSRRVWIAALVLAVAWIALSWRPGLPPTPPPVPLPQDRLFHPDVVIQSRALSQLPRDLLAIPLLGDLLTEEFVFYYERNESRLTLEGAFRRLAYERHLGVGDEIIAHVLDTPAEVALWKNRDGKLKDYLLLLPKKGLLRFVEALSWLAEGDSQLSRQGKLKLPNGDDLSLWRIRHTPRSSLYLAVSGEYLAVFTDPALFDPRGGTRLAAIGQFFASAGAGSLGVSMRLPPLSGRHRLAARASFLSFGYQHFFPSLETFRIDFQPETGWDTAVLANAVTPLPGDLWERLPAAPALCVALPVDKDRLLGYLRKLRDDPLLPGLVENLRPPAALCWYGDSRLHTPIAVLPLSKRRVASAPVLWRPFLGSLFAQNIGTRESPDYVPEDDDPSLPSAGGGEESSADRSRNPLPVTEDSCSGGWVWRRQVSSPHAPMDARSSPHAEAMRSRRYFTVVFALCQETLILTPDATLADRTLGVLRGSYPALADTLKGGGREVSLTVVPHSLAELLRKSLVDSLPAASEPVFRASVEKRFLPLLEKIAGLPARDLETPRQAGGWEPLSWRARPVARP